MKKKCLIIGGSGFIGKNIARTLNNKNQKIKIIDKYIDNLIGDNFFLKNFEIGQVDVNDTASLIRNLDNYENIIWLVHSTVPSNSMIDMSADLNANISPLVNFLSRIKDNPNIEKFIYFSSGGTVYGNPEFKNPINEDHSIEPISNYGLTKFVAEQYIRLILKNSNISSYILRPSNVYGPYQNLNKPQGIIGHAFKAAINEHPLFLYKNGEIIRDFVHVEDLANAVYKCINRANSSENMFIYNIGSGEPISMNELIQWINKITGKKISIINKPSRELDCEYNVLDCKEIKKDINWEAEVNIQEGLKSVWEWIQDEQKS